MLLLEVDHLLGDGIDIAVEVGDTFLDILGRELEDASLVFHGIFVIHHDQGIEHISRASWRRVGDGKAKDGVFSFIIGGHFHGIAVPRSNGGHRMMLHIDGDIVIRFVVEPGVGHSNPADWGVHGVAHMNGHFGGVILTLEFR